ncbi:hypothetical protein SSX86_023071 [Deinandra increscens subsp. villosa]|uniref:Vacuolar protein sorting-associated protein 62 n=1 Tax=Deinandra increscens subsp. villosa TaxID=3103831 RepID=A0AAP0GQW7_9ASTR
MSSILLSRVSLHACITILITFHIVCDTSWAEKIAFDVSGPLPKYPKGGKFGKGPIDLGGLEVYEAFYFKKIWSSESGGPKGLGASFYEPTAIPIPGFHVLGHYCKPNSVDKITPVLTAKDTTGNPRMGSLKRPIDYTLIWHMKDQNSTHLEGVYIWLPIAPFGYRAVGHIVTTSPERPSLDRVRCVRWEYTDLTDVDEWLWGGPNMVHVYTTKPRHGALSVPVGTFTAETSLKKYDLSCLKMFRGDPYAAMPNSIQIKKMIKTYGPWVYFHPDEQYFPSSVLWFFYNGASLHQNDQNLGFVLNNGDNLPTTGGPDDAYLDLPYDQNDKERVMRGFLHDAVSYIHVKPALGGIYTDVVIWLYYPFNGGGKLQLGPFTIDLGVIGEHVSDWEHITLRIDNFHGALRAVYLSQHAKGKWLRPREFELMNGTRPVVYAALYGHAHYATPTYHLHTAGNLDSLDIRTLYDEFEKMNSSSKSHIVRGDKYLGFGVRDDAEKSNKVMDIASSYEVVSIDYKSLAMQPWLNYIGRWGPKILYDFTKEILKIADKLPENVKQVAIKILNTLPPELLGEEGPTGPKMRENWFGDERV